MNTIIANQLAELGRGSQARLAEAVGVNKSTVGHWASGRATPEPARWPAIEAALGLEGGSLQSAHLEEVRRHRAADAGNNQPGLAEALRPLDDDLRRLSAEVARLRAEVEQLRSERQPPSPASDR